MPRVVIGLAIVNALALLATYIFSSSQIVFSRYGFTPAQPQGLTALSSMFLHVGIFHFIGNMFFLWMFGYRVENTFGSLGFCVMYLLCGFGATGLHYLLNRDSPIPCVGASGAISGIMGCYFVLFPKSRFDLEVFFLRFHVRSIPTYTHGAIGIWIGEQALLGLISQSARFSSTAFWAHIGGFATGAAVTIPLLWVFPHLRVRGEQPFMVRYVRGAVHDSNGSVLSNARLELRLHSGERMTGVTNSKGRFAFANVPDGCHTFIVARQGWRPVEANVVVSQKTRYSVPIKIRMQRIQSDEVNAEPQASAAQA